MTGEISHRLNQLQQQIERTRAQAHTRSDQALLALIQHVANTLTLMHEQRTPAAAAQSDGILAGVDEVKWREVSEER